MELNVKMAPSAHPFSHTIYSHFTLQKTTNKIIFTLYSVKRFEKPQSCDKWLYRMQGLLLELLSLEMTRGHWPIMETSSLLYGLKNVNLCLFICEPGGALSTKALSNLLVLFILDFGRERVEKYLFSKKINHAH